MLVVCTCAAAPAGSARADEGLPLRARGMLGIGTMVSADQVERMHFDSIGLISDLQLSYVLFPWLDLQAALAGGGFSAPEHTGGLLAPLLGASVRMPWASLRPYAMLQAGPGYSGKLVRPFFRAGIGLDVPIAHAFECGPVLGYGQLFQSDGPGYSTDARFLWGGISLAFRPGAGPDPKQREVLRIRHVTHHEWLAPPPEAAKPPPDPSPELLQLIEQTLPTEQSELLAPVLFQFDSAELEPIGVAMLHEVARELNQRPEIELLEVQAYADERGSVEYNQALSKRRAEAVIAWLCEHGVARERLRAAPLGASAPVEPGKDEPSYQQNRRVVFRVVQMKAVAK